MLEPREADIPILFIVLVLLPLVAYILLGKWSDAAKKRHRISLLTQLATEETCKAETMAVGDVIPLTPPSRSGVHECALCFARATTRCSRCKSIRYCSGKCQIIHWRQVHKHECQPLDDSFANRSPLLGMMEYSSDASICGDNNMRLLEFPTEQAYIGGYPLENSVNPSAMFATNTNSISMSEGRIKEKQISDKLNRDVQPGNGFVCDILEELHGSMADYSSSLHARSTKEASTRSKDSLRSLEQISGRGSKSESIYTNGCAVAFSMLDDNGEKHTADVGRGERDSFPTRIAMKGLTGDARRGKPAKVMTKCPGEQFLKSDNREKVSVGMTRDLRSTQIVRPDTAISAIEKQERSKMLMLFPYEEFVSLFQHEAFELTPRGLVNCGNSCYANAVLQCLTSTKPLTVYLLLRSHSRNCRVQDWCLICELEQHVAMLRETGVPLSPSRILLHMQHLNRQIGNGSQEDAHEFLRLLIASMQSTCLEGLGGEKKVNLRLQETTFVQHTFGGRLKSKVKCLQCHQESERYENILDLTLEIDGWVGSLEDALKKFTTPEHLEGENMYICGRCGSYVRARKQLRIHEAPNVLTIVLKRFQEGKYGKISKHITFPETLDMIPYMTGTDDMPPLYMLYAVVVHLDTRNASFSGHYVAYVRNLLGTWFRIDDSVVQPVPSSEVMSEGAYILFYIRSCPRPQRLFNAKAAREPDFVTSKHCALRSESLRPVEAKPSNLFAGQETVLNARIKDCDASDGKGKVQPTTGNCKERFRKDFSDATLSDWSLFTSSDDASFTTESTRDSFSTADTDVFNADPGPSTFNPLEYPSQNPIPCKLFSSSGAQTRFVPEERGYVLDSYLSQQHLDNRSLHRPGKMDASSAGLPSDRNGAASGHWKSCSVSKHVSNRTSSLL